jgi:hypothetical protein
MNDIQNVATPEENPSTAREYTIGIDNDVGGCYDIVVNRNGKPIATLTAGEGQAVPLVHAGNCHATLMAALNSAWDAIEEATDIMFSGKDGTPVTFLKPREIEDAYLTLCGVMVQVHEAIEAGEPP